MDFRADGLALRPANSFLAYGLVMEDFPDADLPSNPMRFESVLVPDPAVPIKAQNLPRAVIGSMPDENSVSCAVATP